MKINHEITKEEIERTLKVLIDNGIENEEAETVLQAIGYTLLRYCKRRTLHPSIRYPRV